MNRKSIIGIMMMNEEYKITLLKNQEYMNWILKKHYAKRRCSVSYAYGLVHNNSDIVGVCTFGYPPNYNYNDGACIFYNIKILTLELNRLVINSNNEKNLLSYFVSNCLKQLPKPTAIVSYADPNNNHYGYIYQATNWLYTGESTPKKRYTFEDGSTFDIRRGIHTKGKIVKTEKLKPTLRYIFLNGNKKQKKMMFNDLKLTIQKYPKGNNKNYKCQDISMKYQPNLFEQEIK